ncbi:MAG TPA: hypothetical protein PLI42_00560 [Candidatus Pacearchaeota archaeon]|nr:hypothetical protein [Candidatus Pacearchaeota archaeon]
MSNYNQICYITITDSISPATTNLNILENNLPPNYKVVEWVIFNDALVGDLEVSLSLDEDTIKIKGGEYFGDKRATKTIYLHNNSLDTIPFRCVVKAL